MAIVLIILCSSEALEKLVCTINTVIIGANYY